MADPLDFVCIYEPFTAEDVALIHAKLTPSGIQYYIVNEHYAQGGPGIGDASMRLMVGADRAGEARELIRQCERLRDS